MLPLAVCIRKAVKNQLSLVHITINKDLYGEKMELSNEELLDLWYVVLAVINAYFMNTPRL